MKMKDLPMVYAIEAEDLKYVKIGRTKNFKQRLNNIQSGCPFKLRLWLQIRTFSPKETEEYLHSQLNHCLLRGEWFSPNESDQDYLIDFFAGQNLETRRVINALL